MSQKDWTKIQVEFSQLYAIILSIALVFLTGQTLLARYADIASSSLRSRSVLFVKLQRICGCVFFVALLDAGEHCYSLELETQRVWDYAGDNYVHRLIQSKTDGKLVELNQHCSHADVGCGSCDCGMDPGFSEALMNSKVEAIVNEYNELLTTQLENQKNSLLREVEEETKRDTSEAVEKALAHNPKLQKMQAKLDKCLEELKFLDDINDNLLRNKEIWEAKIVEIQEREKKAVKQKDAKIRELEEQLRDLMLCIEEGNPTTNGIEDGRVSPS
ncbi:unnamed protein product [Ilex paraguariensis]|uniref:UBP-type domain-containing protein n=1 Tax=Ilex paraguariensis TaxID=185542 RepID=A0ABC8RG54_9AQUA